MATFTNQATLTYNGGTVNSNIVTGELVQVLTASKTAAAESYRTGDLVTYVVQLRSTGAAALTGLTVTDTLGTTNFPATGGTVQLTPLTYQAGTLRYFMNGVLQTAPAVTVLANGIRIEGITVPAGGVITLVYTTRVNAFADPSAEGTIENTVTVTGGGLTDAVTATETLPAAAAAELRIVKALEPVRVSDSGTLTYTFTIENYGSADADAAAGVTVTDRFDPIQQYRRDLQQRCLACIQLHLRPGNRSVPDRARRDYCPGRFGRAGPRDRRLDSPPRHGHPADHRHNLIRASPPQTRRAFFLGNL